MGVLVEILSDIEHRQWAQWAHDYLYALDSERQYMLLMVKQPYQTLSLPEKHQYVPWAQQATHALMASGQRVKDTQRTMDLIMQQDHEQRKAWLTYQAENMTQANALRWERQIATHYDDLSEKEKDSDREWAQKLLNSLKKEFL